MTLPARPGGCGVVCPAGRTRSGGSDLAKPRGAPPSAPNAQPGSASGSRGANRSVDGVSLAAGVIGKERDVPSLETFRARQIEVLSNRQQPRELDRDIMPRPDR